LAATNEFAAGSGKKEDPYLVKNAEQLNNVRNHLQAHFKQVMDIDLAGWNGEQGWQPIASEVSSFEGVYDGQSHVIKNLEIKRPEEKRVGLFTSILNQGKIMNLHLQDVKVKGRNNVGALVGEIERGMPGRGGILARCHASGRVEGEEGVGGLTGENNGIIRQCETEIKVVGEKDVGGIVGRNWYTYDTITGYYLDEDTQLEGEEFDGAIYDCLSSGLVRGTKRVGGIAGFNADKIENCLSLCRIEGGDNYIGALVGGNFEGDIIDSYYSRENSGQSDQEKGIGLSEEELKDTEYFESWDLKQTWILEVQGAHPRLRWVVG